jgi:hypothetical protein
MTGSRRAVFLRLGILLAFATLGIARAKAQDKDYGELAGRIVKTSASVKPGDVVVAGGKHDVALMEDLAIEAR